jgi:diguanylate cyclase (GGDEF)-like protein
MAQSSMIVRARSLASSNSKLARLWVYGALVGLLCISGIIGSWYGADWLARDLVLEKMVSQAQTLQNRVASILSDNKDVFEKKQLPDVDVSGLDIYIKSSGSYRIIFFDRDGVAFWSTNTARIGTKIEDDYFYNILKSGGIYSELRTKKPHEIDGWFKREKDSGNEVWQDRYVTEIYVPVVYDGQFYGVIKHYHDVTDEIRLYRRNLRVIGVLGGIALWLVSGIIMMQILRSARQREADLKLINETQSKAIANESQRVRESRLLSELNEWLQSCRSLDELYDMIATFMTKLLPNTAGSLYIYSNSRDVLDGVKSWNHSQKLQPMQADECWGLRRGRTYAYGSNEIDFLCSHVDKEMTGEYRCIPIVAHGETIGLLHLFFRRHLACEPASSADCQSCTALCEDERRLSAICAEQISLAIANVRLRDQLRDQSIRDPLTGLFNRRYMIETCRREIARVRRSGKPLSLLSIDVDHFKLFNDNHGHDAGDTVLRTVGENLSFMLREEDIVCRQGGEEFVMIMPETALEDALKRAEQVRARIESIVLRYGDRNLPRITISGGIAVFPQDGSSTEQLLETADKSLYLAKSEGRNCIRALSATQADNHDTDQSEAAEHKEDKDHRPAVLRHAS